MGAILALLLKIMPYIQLATHIVEAVAPVETPGNQKKSVVTAQIHDILGVASAAGTELGKLHDAVKAQDAAAVGDVVSQGIELAVSAAKAFGAFPKAGIVQNAPTLDTVLKRMVQSEEGAV